MVKIGLLKRTVVKWIINGGNKHKRKKITDEYLENFLKIIVVQCLKSGFGVLK